MKLFANYILWFKSATNTVFSKVKNTRKNFEKTPKNRLTKGIIKW